MAEPTAPPFARKNWLLLAAGLASIALGYIFLRIPPADGFFSLTLAPLLLVVGYCALLPMAILHKSSELKESEPS